MDVPEHLVHTLTDRGFKHLPPVKCQWGMDALDAGHVKVYESSSASHPSIWLNVLDRASVLTGGRDPDAEVTVHLTVEAAQLLSEQLAWLVEHHYWR